jgi:catabolite regulation protein CreA
VKKGTVITFVRTGGGHILARADNHDLVQVDSPHLSQAVMDIYLGKQVVSEKARKVTGESFVRLLSDAELEAIDDPLVCKDEACRVGRFQKSTVQPAQKTAQ